MNCDELGRVSVENYMDLNKGRGNGYREDGERTRQHKISHM